jgi:hypothetical protein
MLRWWGWPYGAFGGGASAITAAAHIDVAIDRVCVDARNAFVEVV